MQSWRFTKENSKFKIDRTLMEEIRLFLRMFMQFKSQNHVQVNLCYNELIFILRSILSFLTRIETKIRYTAGLSVCYNGLLCHFIKIKPKKKLSKYEILKQSEFINESLLEFIFLHISTLSLYLPPYKSAIASGLSSTRKVRPVGWTPSRICLRSEPRIVTCTRRQARVVCFLMRGGFSFYVMQKIFLSSSFGQPYEV